MSLLTPLPDWIEALDSTEIPSPSYFYEGICPDTEQWMRLPRTTQSEAAAQWLMESFAHTAPTTEGKMFGVLIVETTLGTRAFLKAFSGLLNGHSFVKGWVPPLPGHEHIALDEALTLEALGKMKGELIKLGADPAWNELRDIQAAHEAELAVLSVEHSAAKKQRKKRRAALKEELEGEELRRALRELEHESQTQREMRRDLRREHKADIAELEAYTNELNARIEVLKKQRKEMSRSLQAHMHSVYSLTNFAGATRPLQALVKERNLPSGTGDCCAPRLLYYAATHGLKPLGLAEFWWGPTVGEREQGRFYEACESRCQPIMGFLLSGLPTEAQEPTFHEQGWSLPWVHKDESMLVVDKPYGMLSVPGSRTATHDSALSRAKHLFPDITGSGMVHRLDMETSGILLIARNPVAQRSLCAQFRERSVEKLYEAVLDGEVAEDEGRISLPLCPEGRGSILQRVDWEEGRESVTLYRVLERGEGWTRIEFRPITGRTHQLRVHAASPEGLGAPIRGDQLYHPAPEGRLHLHARTLRLQHPHTEQTFELHSPAPF